MNNSDPEISLPEDQCILAQNVEYINSMLGDRRLGSTVISLPAAITACARVTYLFRHLPSTDATAAELWVLGMTSAPALVLARKTTSWATVTISDTPATASFAPYRWQMLSIHGKLFCAYDSDQDRLHVVDSTGVMRRVGLKAPTAAPTAADVGSGAVISGVRYYRVRYNVTSGSTVLLRSEPSAVLTHTPSGTPSSVTVTKPATISENETHWELEASTDNANFYRIATTAVGTSTYSDTANSYTNGTLSEDTGDYSLPWSARYLSHDDDRLLYAGSWETDAYASRVGWTPVYGASGVGNDERSETDTTPYKDLDTYEHGQITGISTPIFGSIWVFKQSAIYKLTRTGIRTSAYEQDKYTDAMGAIHGSVISGLDEGGNPCIYFLDYEAGPCRIGIGGIKRCGEDIRMTWSGLNINATKVVTSALYYPKKKQAIWCIATGSSDIPDTAIVLHIDKARTFAEGVRKGWVLWTSDRAEALTMCSFASNIDDGAARNLNLVPFIGLEGLGLVHRCDTTNADNSVAFTATTTTKPYWLKTILNKFKVRRAALVAKATSAAAVDVKVFRDFQLETTDTDSSVTFTATGSETNVIKDLDDLKGAELRVVQFQFTDISSPTAQWQLNQIAIQEEPEQTA